MCRGGEEGRIHYGECPYGAEMLLAGDVKAATTDCAYAGMCEQRVMVGEEASLLGPESGGMNCTWF